MNKVREYRVFNVSVRAEGENHKIEGYAAVFNTVTDLGFFKEQIAPGAFARAITEKQDVRCLMNHDPNAILGRTKNGSLELVEDNTGLKFRCDLPNTQLGRDTHELIRRGDMDQCSFGFVVKDEEVTYGDNGDQLRTVKDVDLFDVSAVTYPAYETTSVEARSLEEVAKRYDGKEPDEDDAERNSDCACDCTECQDGNCADCSNSECDDPNCEGSERSNLARLTYLAEID